MAKLFTSEKYIISIDEFMTNYINKTYDGNEKLTHHVMEMYLYEKHLPRVTRVKFSQVTKTDVLTGNFLLVRDHNNQVIVYRNPAQHSLASLLSEINATPNKKNLEKIRKAILKEEGYTHDNDGSVISLEEWKQNQRELALETTDKVNRQKYISKRHYY